MTERPPVPILYVHHRRELGGSPESLAYLIRNLDRSRFEPHVYVPEGASADLFRAAGSTVHPGTVAAFTHIWASTYHGLRWALLVRELVRLPAHARGLRATLREVRPAVVHVNDSPTLPAAWLARRSGIPIVAHLRSALPERHGALRTRLMRAAVARLADAPIAITSDVAASFEIDATVIPNGVDLARFHPDDEPRPDHPVVSSFGFIYPSKGFRELIAAARMVRDRGIEATYLIVGGGVRGEGFFRRPGGRILTLFRLTSDFEDEARRLVHRLALDDVVRFVPYSEDVADIYRGSDLVAAPSQGPELGRSLVEAAASGVAVVASGSETGGGIVVPGETGILTGRTPSAVADGLAALLQNRERRKAMGRAARAYAELRFEPARNAREVERIYEGLLD